MSIVILKKISICGLIHEKEQVLNGLQELGCIHLVSLREPLAEPEKAVSERPVDAFKALKFLIDCQNRRHQIKEDKNFDSEEWIAKSLKVQQCIRDVSDQRDFLAARIKSVSPWGNFKLPLDDDLAGLRLWFYIVPVGKLSALPKKNVVWQIVHKDSRFAHVVVVAEDEPPTHIMPVIRTHTGTLSLTELKAKLNETELELEDLRAERESLTRWIFLITRNLARAEDKAKLIHAAEQTMDAGEVFAVQGWLPERQLDRLCEFTKQSGLAVTIEDPRPSDTPPTLLENPEQLSAGEDLIGFYQTPGYWDWDPAIPVFFSFALFFAMIMSDAGYAVLLGVFLLGNWRQMGKSQTGQHMRVLAATLVSSSIIWGVLVGSYFGVSPSGESLMGKLKVLDVNDFDTMMRLSVCVGVLHLTYANFHKALRLRKEGYSWLVPLGWILVMFGALCLWFDQLLDKPPEWISPTGKLHIGLGFVAIFLFSSNREVRKPTDTIMRILDGLKGLAGVTKIFGDVLSYLRLFALGLASASLALTFNNLALQAREVEGLGLLFSLLILIIGHGLNIALSLMSAVVHGMRLNCIEFFNWGLSDEGYPFKTFSKKEISE
ncbi:MAG: ATPase [Methylococcales bacterium]